MELSTVLRVLSEHDNYETVHDVVPEYGEPGYSTRGGPILLGDWWCRDRSCNYPDTYDDGKKKVHGLEYHYPRVFAFLEREGCELEWYDEWTAIYDENKCYRVEGTSYSWEPRVQWSDDLEDYMTPETDAETWIEWATNDPRKCLFSWYPDAELERLGFVERQCDYESGWYGVEDDPTKILEAIKAREDVDVLFKLAGVEQFRVRFCVYVRPAGDPDWDALSEGRAVGDDRAEFQRGYWDARNGAEFLGTPDDNNAYDSGYLAGMNVTRERCALEYVRSEHLSSGRVYVQSDEWGGWVAMRDRLLYPSAPFWTYYVARLLELEHADQ